MLVVDLDFEGGLRMLSIRVDSIELTWIVRIDWSLWPRFKNKEGSCIVISRILTSSGLCRVGWKCCRFKSIWLNRHELFPLLLIRHAGSRFAIEVTPCEPSWDVMCKLSWMVKCLRRINSVWVYWTWMLEIVLTASCYRNWDKLWQLWARRLQGFTLPYFFFRKETGKHWMQYSHIMVKRPFLTGLLFFLTLMRLCLHLIIDLFFLRQGKCSHYPKFLLGFHNFLIC